jgi:hypothetical protein
MKFEVGVFVFDVELGIVGQLLPVALLHVVGLQLVHQLESLAHIFDFGLRVGEDFVLLLLEFLFLEVHFDGRALKNEVVEHDLFPREFIPVVEEQLHLGREVPNFFESEEAFLAIFDFVEHGLLQVEQFFAVVEYFAIQVELF